jgi:Ser/Thr protein kinase RdoA (MazF antagonist)
LHELKTTLAILFAVTVAEIDLEPITAGLTHKSFCCRVDGQRFFVKVYRAVNNAAAPVQRINQLTAYMCERGVPASRVFIYSPAFAHIVVHEFVEGEMHRGQYSQIAAIAQLYSQLALLGAEQKQLLAKTEYLSGIRAVVDQIGRLESAGIKVDASIHAGMLALGESVLETLQAGLSNEGLLHIPIHDDFSEKNILLQGDQVKLLCDWDSYRLKQFNEHLASTVTRFSTERPLMGELRQDKLEFFLRSLKPEVIGLISDSGVFAELFPYWATLKHLRTYVFRNSLLQENRMDLKTSLLQWPLHHCTQLLTNKQQISDQVYRLIKIG